ncbi:DUF3298 domain-containing protein [Candidatus Merdisoma sp. HCP28S3_D10]|uniref:RsiV family protein n=1 Tax=unclassified Candidatus Merdisoma TaxID=3099611 RepID=UPI003F8AD29E
MKDERLRKMNQEYHEIPIPAELRNRVNAGIRAVKKERKRNKTIVFTKTAGGAVAAALIAITVMVNSGANIAHAMAKIPVIGAIAEVVTFREYQDSTNQMYADVKVPEVEVKNEDGTVNQESTDAINQSIQEYTDEIIAQYQADVEAADGQGYQAVDLDYQVITDSERLFSIRFDKLVIMASGEETVKIYHIDKKTGELINLSGIFKEGVNYIDPISENIRKQMKEQMAADENVTYWLDSDTPEWDFKSITADTTFYINEEGRLVIVFDEGEVAPMSMGSVEFTIPTEVIQDIVQDGFIK